MQLTAQQLAQHEAAQQKQEALEHTYQITGHDGIILAPFNNQRDAIKEFICFYKPRGSHFKLWHVHNGRRKELNPTGKPADYNHPTRN